MYSITERKEHKLTKKKEHWLLEYCVSTCILSLARVLCCKNCERIPLIVKINKYIRNIE
jgi:hypothetical protein